MISFYPGPSRVHDEIPAFVKDAFRDGILSINHRSEEFMAISHKTISLLRQKLDIPKTFTIFFTSSATECWEIIAQSMVKAGSYHFYNGAFGEKWFDYTRRLCPSSKGISFATEEKLNLKKIGPLKKDSVLCITQNETSNGTQVDMATIRALKRNHPECIVAVDATSSMAGISLAFNAADIWFGSVQKCFGLPAGLGLLICSPKAMQRAAYLGERKHYNSLTFMSEMMAKWQTPYTPNVMGIYLLMRVLERSKPIVAVHKKVIDRYNEWISFLSERKDIAHLVKNKAVQSYTVIPVSASPEVAQTIKSQAKKKGMLLGEGYGIWKANTFRIANFPALKKKELKKLMRFLKHF
ncbi:MAG: aminotransferase class V-fold PLP-dependent enzyme [Cyclobacteriaceae bacterium]|nr:aminotransferase class V-fold PLP-dependent enzyme [Cyclobacteriaceae bacterium]MDH5248517.1 aminotransferase class V-fold PLP-dependent enzyme [Cyclobacteriaceae bacterium]